MTPRFGVVLGTRPEIIKLAPMLLELDRRSTPRMLIHTNQHYDWELDARFFDELELAPPDHNLHVGSGTHGAQTGRMLALLESTFVETPIDRVIVQGDTNTGLAGALAATKLQIPVAHVEAGLRSFDRRMPEETNRRLIDHIADDLFPPTATAHKQLRRESVPGRVHEPTGNTIVDAVLHYSPDRHLPLRERDQAALLTLHRPENVDERDVLASILRGVAEAAREHGLRVAFPIHPRTQARLSEFGLDLPEPIEAESPKSFRELLSMQARARLVMTDSGGIQEESCVLGTPCVVLRTHTDRPELVEAGSSSLAGVAAPAIVEAARGMMALPGTDWPQPIGDGNASVRIVDALLEGAEAPSPRLG